MVRLWKEVGLSATEASGYGEELGRLAFVVFASLVTLSVFAAIVFLCADGASRNSARASAAANNHDHGSTCAAACGAGCGG